MQQQEGQEQQEGREGQEHGRESCPDCCSVVDDTLVVEAPTTHLAETWRKVGRKGGSPAQLQGMGDESAPSEWQATKRWEGINPHDIT